MGSDVAGVFKNIFLGLLCGVAIYALSYAIYLDVFGLPQEAAPELNTVVSAIVKQGVALTKSVASCL